MPLSLIFFAGIPAHVVLTALMFLMTNVLAPIRTLLAICMLPKTAQSIINSTLSPIVGHML